MISLSEFRIYAHSNMMELEAILAEVYTAHLEGQRDFALFDGGAHKGFHTTRMAALSGCLRVYAVEADPFMAETLKGVLDTMPPAERARVMMVQKALQNDPATTSIAWKSSPSHVGRSSIVSDNEERSTIWGDNPDMEYREEMTISATTIDSVLDNEEAPLPFLKSDLEGADLLALLGAEQTLMNKRPIIAFENSVHAPKVHGFTLEDMAAYFARLDYVPLNFVGEAIGPDNWFGFFEAWACPREHVDWLRDTLKACISRRVS